MKILVVEDSPDLQLFYQKLLRLWGHEPTLVSTLAEAITSLEMASRPDLILLDLTLPDATLEDLQTAIHGHQFEGVPFALTSGRDDLELWERHLGAQASFQKPIDIPRLKGFIQALTPERDSKNTLPDHPVGLSDGIPSSAFSPKVEALPS